MAEFSASIRRFLVDLGAVLFLTPGFEFAIGGLAGLDMYSSTASRFKPRPFDDHLVIALAGAPG